MHAMFRRLVLLFLFLLAQSGALAHGISHGFEQEDEGLEHKLACELCMAYAPLGAGVASTPEAWVPPAAVFHFQADAPVATFLSFRPLYLSRAPPL